MNRKYYLLFLCTFAIVFSACSSDSDNISYPAQDEEIVEVPEVPEDPGAEDDDELVPNTQTVSYNNAVSITFSVMR